MKTIQDLVAEAYRDRLQALGIPGNPANRTADQTAQAAQEAWGAALQGSIEAGWMSQSEMERRS